MGSCEGLVMSKQQQAAIDAPNDLGNDSGSATATAVKPRTKPAPPRVDKMPQWKVLLHNDDVNELGYVVETVIQLIRVNTRQAILQTIEAHTKGVALLTT